MSRGEGVPRRGVREVGGREESVGLVCSRRTVSLTGGTTRVRFDGRGREVGGGSLRRGGGLQGGAGAIGGGT